MKWQETLLVTESGGDVRAVRSPDIFEYRDPRNEEATLNRWRPVLAELGIEVLGIRDVPASPVRVTVDGVDWDLKRISQGTYTVPSRVYDVICQAQEHNVPFAYYLWGEEQFDRPTFRPGITPSGTSVEAGVSRSSTDPILIGVIPTAPNRGVWCKLGAWFH